MPASASPSVSPRSSSEYQTATPSNDSMNPQEPAPRPRLHPWQTEPSNVSGASIDTPPRPQPVTMSSAPHNSAGQPEQESSKLLVADDTSQEDQDRLIEEARAERRRKRREREEQARIELQHYEEEQARRRRERRERRERRRGLSSGTESVTSTPSRPEKITQGTNEKSLLVSAVNNVHWAPLNIPLPRRLQTGAVLWHTLSMPLCFSIFWFVLAIPLSWPFLLPYLIYVFFFATNHADGSAPYKRSEFLRSLPIWRLYTEYFPIRLHRTVVLDPTKNYIFAYHPHGIISHGAFGNFCTEATGFKELFPGIKNTLLTLDSNFNIPFNREYLLAMGLASVSRVSCEALLRGNGLPKKNARSLWKPTTYFRKPSEEIGENEGGRAITIVIGGARESLEATPGTMKLVCRTRRGFIKLAMREGAGIVPVLSFGENDIYEQLMPDRESWIRKMQMAVKKTMGFTIPLAHARGVFNYDVGVLPYRREINTVVGKPIFPPKTLEPTDQEVAEFHKMYMEQLQKMWDEYKDVFAKNRLPGEEGELQIIE